MFRALATSSTAVAALAQRQTRVQAIAAFHSSSPVRNNSTAGLSELLANLRTSTNNSSNASNNNNNISKKTSILFGSSRSGTSNKPEMSFFGSTSKANVTSNPIHLGATDPTEGRSFRVKSAGMVDQTYRRLRTALNQSNMKRELRLRRNYEDGHTRMRRENQERNKKLFGAMVKKKIELIKLMKIRGM
ncbi:hypothetical protein BGX27_004469 [Mortierella sp. AM989]|nr:hypothetical protein BGX27_004469 [Mortierella sp. AM989]